MTTIRSRTLRPGYLVALSVRVAGGVEYRRRALPVDGTVRAPEGAAVAHWETVRIIQDPDEYERAGDTRGAAYRTVARTCVQTDFGLLCPSDKFNTLSE